MGLPLAFGRLLWRSRLQPAYRQRWGERLGLGPCHRAGAVWLHAVSVGEVNAAVPLIAALQEAHPALPVLLMSGYASALLEAPPGWHLLRKPYTRAELGRAMARALAGIRPG